MTSINDRNRLRDLAGKYAQMTNSEEMNRRREAWRLSNRLEERTVPYVIEDNGTFFSDLMPELRCEGEAERGMERQLLRPLVNFELIPDDRVFTPYFGIGWSIHRPNICPELDRKRVPDATGRLLGFETNKPLADLESGMSKLVRGEFSVNRQATYDRIALAEGIFGDLLPVRLAGNTAGHGPTSMACKAVNLMGMDNFYMAMIDQPENVHRMFDFFATEAEDYLNWLIENDLVLPNNGEYVCGSGSYGYTDELPRRELKEDDRILPEDCWGFPEAQEAAGVSNEMFAEFIFPPIKRLAERYGLLYYGCCEPVHVLWPTISRLKRLRKITISPWCNQEMMAEACGRRVVLSRKPHPMKLCDPEKFDAADFEAHIRETLDIAKDNFVELIFRDTCPFNGSMQDRVREACAIVRRLIGR